MSVDPAPSSLPLTADTSSPAPRLWPAVVLLALYWSVRFLLFRLDMLYFYRFVLTTALVGLLMLAYFGWWWLSRRRRFADKVYGFLVVAAGFVAAGFVAHPSMGRFGLFTAGLPVVLTAWTAWMLLVRRTGFAWHRLGTLVVIFIAWGFFTLTRMDGADTELNSAIHWRWQPTAEEHFLANRPIEEAPTTTVAGWDPTLTPDDWPAFRGPEREGVIRSGAMATDWGSRPPRLLWKQPIGPAWSSVIVVGDRLFTQEQRGDQEAVVCYNALTGHQIWSHEDRDRFSESVSGTGPRATPTYAAGRIYALGAMGRLNCLDAATGRPIWTHNLAADVGAQPPMWGFSGSPLVVDGLVIVFARGADDKHLAAFRADTGEPAWTAFAGLDSYSSPQLVTLAGRRQCLMLGDHALMALEPATGEVLWTHGQIAKGAPRAVQAHVVGDNQFIIGSLAATPTVSRMQLSNDGGSWTPSELWATSDLKPEYNDFVIHNGYAYGFDVTRLCCIDLTTGKRRWKGPRLGRCQLMVLPEQALLLALTEAGEAILLAANPVRDEELGRFQALNGKTWNHPVIAHGRLYVRNAEEMACYELAR